MKQGKELAAYVKGLHEKNKQLRSKLEQLKKETAVSNMIDGRDYEPSEEEERLRD